MEKRNSNQLKLGGIRWCYAAFCMRHTNDGMHERNEERKSGEERRRTGRGRAYNNI